MNELISGLCEFRAVYLAAGPLAARILKETFAPFKADTEMASGLGGKQLASAVADTNANFAIVPFDLGFPPGIAGEQHDYFRSLSAALSSEGVESIALITSSSYFPEGEYSRAPWAARLPNGKPVYYSRVPSRIAACWNNPEWISRLRSAAEAALDAGATGIFLDAVSFGAAPVYMKGALEGPAGCHCAKCKEDYSRRQGNSGVSRIPPVLKLPGDVNSVEYMKWRAGVVSSALADIKKHIKGKDESALFVISAPYLAALPTLHIFGLDPATALELPDVCCVEHGRFPSITPQGLVYESPMFKVIRESARGALPASLAYPFGPSPDGVPQSMRAGVSVVCGLSEGAAPVVRFGEFRDRPDGGEKMLDYMAGEKYAEQREAVALIFNWAEKNRDIYEGATPAAGLGLLFSWEIMAKHPESAMQRVFYTTLQTLTEVQVPVKALVAENLPATKENEVRVVIVPFAEETPEVFSRWVAESQNKVRLIFVGEVPEWADAARSSALPLEMFDFKKIEGAKESFPGPVGKWLIKKMYGGSAGIYGGFPISGRAGIPPPMLSRIPETFCMYQPNDNWQKLRDAVTGALKEFPEDVVIEAPPYIHVHEWRKNGESYFHVINLAPGFPGVDAAQLKFPSPVTARVLDSVSNKIIYHKNETAIVVRPAPYVVVNVKNRGSQG